MIRLLLSLMLLLCSAAIAAAVPPGFDPERHMLVSEVRPGMTGYGLSVFSGTTIERFQVEVISVLRNFNPKQDVVLIRVSGANLEHTGAIAGMSGSPIYLQDEEGKSRLIGAFAYGWPMMKDPLAGVQPIEYMLAAEPARQAQQSVASLPSAASRGEWSLLAAIEQKRQQMASASAPSAGKSPFNLTKMALPLSISGLSPAAVQEMSGLFASVGLLPMQAGGGSSGKKINLEPGSVMAIPLLVGDIDMTAVGTCTEVIGDRVYGFGHPFTGTGPIELPMCGGEIQGVIANLVTSFKLGSASQAVGTLLSDRTSGVAGRIGDVPEAAPIQWHVRYEDGSLDQEFNFRAAVHPQFTPLLASAAAYGAISATRELPYHNTLDYSLKISFSGGHSVQLADRLVNVNPFVLFDRLGMPMSAATENPFGRVLVKQIEGEIVIREGAASAEILHVGSPRQIYRPGETVRFYVTLRPFRSVDVVKELELELPDDLADGSYTLVVSDAARFLGDEQSASPFRFTAGKLEDVFDVISDFSSIRSDALHLRLMRSSQGVAVGRTSLPHMPATHRQLLLSAGRSDVVAFTPSVVRHLPSEWVISGSAELTLEVSRTGKPATPKG